jgi:hypothetical protein
LTDFGNIPKFPSNSWKGIQSSSAVDLAWYAQMLYQQARGLCAPPVVEILVEKSARC